MADPITYQNLLDAIIQRESSGNPRARSKAGAIGLMGIMPADAMEGMREGVPDVFSAARSLGYAIDPADETRDMAEMLLQQPDINTLIGEKYLQELLKKYRGDTEGTLTAYNAGPAAYDKAGSAAALGPKEQREYSGKVSEDYNTLFGRPLPKNLGVLVSPRPPQRPKQGLLY